MPRPPHRALYFAPCRYDTRRDIKFAPDAPVIGLVLQRSHLVTGDEGHYAGEQGAGQQNRAGKVSGIA